MAISNFRKNCMGTMSFQATFKGMRKAQDFIVYPIGTDSDAKTITIQSNTRIGQITLADGKTKLSPSVSSGAYFHHMMLAKEVPPLSGEELLLLKSNVFSTADANAGSRGITCDNSSAVKVFA